MKRLFIDRQFKDGENPKDYVFIPATVDDNTSFDVQYKEDGSYVLSSSMAGKTGFGTLTTTFSITADGKLAVEYSVNNDGDITTVVHLYSKPN